MHPTLRCRPRLGSSTSLVTENSLEARRRADHDHVVQDHYTGTREGNDGMEVEAMNENRSASGEQLRPRSSQRLHAPYVLQLPPLPTPSLDVAPDIARVEGRFPIDYDLRPLPQPSRSWYVLPRTQGVSDVRRPPPPGFTTSHFVPANSFPNVLPSLPPLHINWPSTSTHEPPFLPPPDLGWAFEAEGQDGDIEMRPTPQIRAVHNPPLDIISESATSTSSRDYLQPRSQVLRLENNPTQASSSDHATTRVSHVPHQYQPARAVMDLPSPPAFRQIAYNAHNMHTAIQEGRRQLQNVSSDVQRHQNMAHEQHIASAESEDDDERSAPVNHPTNNFIPGRYRDSDPIPLPYDPIYHFRPSVTEDREHRQSTYPSYPPYRPYSLDPTAFAPGPFRNTLNESLQHRTDHPTPPIIPPLPFEENGPTSHPRLVESLDLPSRFQEPVRRDSQPFSGRRNDHHGLSPLLNGRSRHNFGQSSPQTLLASPRTPYVGDSNDFSTTAELRIQSALHRFFTGHIRMEPSRLDHPPSLESPAIGSTNNPNRPHVPVSRIDPIRPDGSNITRQIQLINQYQNELERRRRTATRNEGTPAETTQSNSTPRPVGTSRRFGNTDADNHQPTWRARNRGRFRSASEFLSAARMRSGNMSDFVVRLLPFFKITKHSDAQVSARR